MGREKVQRKGVGRIIGQIQKHLCKMDMAAFNRRVEAGLRWGGRCRCDVCERLRSEGIAGLDGVHPQEKM